MHKMKLDKWSYFILVEIVVLDSLCIILSLYDIGVRGKEYY